MRNPSNCVEFINEDGRRYAWSESNVQYEEVPEDGKSFTLLRMRLLTAEERIRVLEEALRLLFYMRAPGGDKIEDLLLEWGFEPEWRKVFEALHPEKARAALPQAQGGGGQGDG